MRSKSRILFVLLSTVWVAANVVWLGCAIVPLPSSRHPIDSRKIADFKFVRKSQPTRDEVIAKLGPPDAYLADLHVACYRINTVTRRKLFLLLFVIPTGVIREQGYDLALVQFDENDRVKRYGLVLQYSYENYQSVARQWVASD